jgi:hypothetical protein
MIRLHGFYDVNMKPEGKGFSNQYRLQEVNGDKIVFDEISCLMWQQSGYSKRMQFQFFKNYIDELNEKLFAGFNDWRLPTLEEAMSLMEPERKNGLYIDPVFDREQTWIWTADKVKGASMAWVVYLNGGICGSDLGYSYVRAVRSGQSDKSD